jgi:hypothetical protein
LASNLHVLLAYCHAAWKAQALHNCMRHSKKAALRHVQVWDFSKRRLNGSIACGSAVTRLCRHADSALVAVAGVDLVIRMYDTEVSPLSLSQPLCI